MLQGLRGPQALRKVQKYLAVFLSTFLLMHAYKGLSERADPGVTPHAPFTFPKDISHRSRQIPGSIASPDF